jgi:hypothetical protein
MNEGPDASVMHDSSSNGIDGHIGDHVVTGYQHGGATGYRWPYVAPNRPPADRQHLVTVWDDRLNPRRRVFAVTVRFRTTRDFGNTIQKGQSGTPGGYFKWQIPNGKLTCLFRGVVNGRVVGKAVNSGKRRLNDGRWHTVTCRRTRDGLTMTIDHRKTRRAIGWTGRIENSKPLSIGRQVQLRSADGHVRLLRRRDRLGPHLDRLSFRIASTDRSSRRPARSC